MVELRWEPYGAISVQPQHLFFPGDLAVVRPDRLPSLGGAPSGGAPADTRVFLEIIGVRLPLESSYVSGHKYLHTRVRLYALVYICAYVYTFICPCVIRVSVNAITRQCMHLRTLVLPSSLVLARRWRNGGRGHKRAAASWPSAAWHAFQLLHCVRLPRRARPHSWWMG